MNYSRSETAAKLRTVRQRISQVAAEWQAQGIDTSPFADPLLVLQEAIVDLEAGNEGDQPHVSRSLFPSQQA